MESLDTTIFILNTAVPAIAKALNIAPLIHTQRGGVRPNLWLASQSFRHSPRICYRHRGIYHRLIADRDASMASTIADTMQQMSMSCRGTATLTLEIHGHKHHQYFGARHKFNAPKRIVTRSMPKKPPHPTFATTKIDSSLISTEIQAPCPEIESQSARTILSIGPTRNDADDLK